VTGRLSPRFATVMPEDLPEEVAFVAVG
jgi:hypothetical protein